MIRFLKRLFSRKPQQIQHVAEGGVGIQVAGAANHLVIGVTNIQTEIKLKEAETELEWQKKLASIKREVTVAHARQINEHFSEQLKGEGIQAFSNPPPTPRGKLHTSATSAHEQPSQLDRDRIEMNRKLKATRDLENRRRIDADHARRREREEEDERRRRSNSYSDDSNSFNNTMSMFSSSPSPSVDSSPSYSSDSYSGGGGSFDGGGSSGDW